MLASSTTWLYDSLNSIHHIKTIKVIAYMPKTPASQLPDFDRELLPHGGATDIFGRVIWTMTEEEEEERVRKIQLAFGA